MNEMKIQEMGCRRILEEQMTIMIESSRTWLWTEYARGGCKCLSGEATDPRAWDRLPVSCFLFPIFSFLFFFCTRAQGRRELFASCLRVVVRR